MKAIVKERYGSADHLKLREVAAPTPTDEQVLVRVKAASVNAHDWHMMRGKPYLARLDEGWRRPKNPSIGVDLAGVAEAVGSGVSDVKPGDEVFGSRYGAYAEYVAAKNVVPKPANLTIEQAAAVPTAGLTALQGLRDHGRLEAGQRVLVNGAGGGVGSFAVQIAKAFGADVTAVTRTANVDLALKLGADHVIDYTRDDFVRGGQRYDLVLDVGGNRSLRHLRRALAPGGSVVLVAPAPGDWVGFLARVVGARISTRLGRPPVRPFLAQVRKEDLLTLKGMIEAGQLKPVIDRTYPFEQTPEAIRYVESGIARGKVVVTVP